MRFVAVTHPINPAGEERLTRGQVYEGLKIKARDPMKFISAIASCKVLSEHPTGLLREVQFKGQSALAHEKVEFFPPGAVYFTMVSPTTGELLASITNVISSTPDGELWLTFTFAWGPNGPLDVSEEAVAQEKEREEMGRDAVAHTIKAIRELVKANTFSYTLFE
ncbi:DUF1857-domain-containing protein [Laetiporus sulphureus 93-53]|uniref:DUF1857-domain-containing protein n=1 Tax=Laetiporus sulphureus 93-53 TaxID=1314785 RepID=A0A165CMN2_9APHY|nr:DUF1857-domain-containing protein [Laetiporus sulphureus 93-53]KZT03088.1 DUF1857-domain-containing protein [Laetiporus sulphureus 93-53]